MDRNQIQDEKEFLRRTVEYLNNITPQLVEAFHTESNKMRYLRNTVFSKKWPIIPSEKYIRGQILFWQTSYGIEWKHPTWS